jgi:hypothetical protein
VGQLANPLATATNPDFHVKGSPSTILGQGYTGQRSIRIGARFTF